VRLIITALLTKSEPDRAGDRYYLVRNVAKLPKGYARPLLPRWL
jgi:hypothetical protein